MATFDQLYMAQMGRNNPLINLQNIQAMGVPRPSAPQPPPPLAGMKGFVNTMMGLGQADRQQQRLDIERQRAKDLVDIQMQTFQAEMARNKKAQAAREALAGQEGMTPMQEAAILAGYGGDVVKELMKPEPKPISVTPGSTLVDPLTNQPLFQAPFKPAAPVGPGDDWKMRKDIERQEAPYQEVASRAAQIRAAVNNPGAFSDVTLASNIAKFLDPTSVVRPSETETIAEAGGLVNSIRSALQSAAGEGMITTPVRKEINAMMDRLLKIYKSEYGAQRKDASDFLSARNLAGDIMGSPVDFPSFSPTVINGVTVEKISD